MDNGIPVSTYWAFGIGAIASTATILVTVLTTSEYPPTEEELAKIQADKEKGNIIQRTWEEIVVAFKEMPPTMKQLIPVMFFLGMPCFAIGNTLHLLFRCPYTIPPTLRVVFSIKHNC